MTRTIPILMYHLVGTPWPHGTPSRSLTVTPQDFAAQMRRMRQFGWRGLAMRDLMPCLDGAENGDKVFGITFDDGFANVLTNALPVLADVGFTATCYFVSRQIGGSNVWDRDKGLPFTPCMTQTQMRQWIDAGQEAGAHTCNHARLGALAFEAARSEIADCRKELEDMTGGAISAFSYPYGDVNREIRNLVAAAGFTSATTIESRTVTARDDRLLLPRLTVRRGEGSLRLLYRCLTR